jgi:hypothetical protein
MEDSGSTFPASLGAEIPCETFFPPPDRSGLSPARFILDNAERF